jgi:hypothetical protein
MTIRVPLKYGLVAILISDEPDPPAPVPVRRDG